MDGLRKSRYVISSFIIIIVCWLGWLCGLVFGQVGGAFTSVVNFPDVALICLVNLAVFFKLILRDKHSYETVAKERMVLIRNVKERNINGLKVMTTRGENLQECSVVMLSFHYPATSGARKFMDSISNAFDVHSILLRCRPLQCGAFTEHFRNCSCTENRDGRCGCIVFNTVEDITMMLARQLPGTLKRLPDSHCLIPSVCCLSKGCHGCNQGLLHAENDTLKEGDPNLESPAAVCEILESIPKVGACICIPVRPFNEDEWTNELIRVFEPQKRDQSIRASKKRIQRSCIQRRWNQRVFCPRKLQEREWRMRCRRNIQPCFLSNSAISGRTINQLCANFLVQSGRFLQYRLGETVSFNLSFFTFSFRSSNFPPDFPL